MTQSTRVLLELVRAGLWEKEVSLSQYGEIDFGETYRLAKEQSVIGLVAASKEKIVDVKVPQTIVLTMAGEVLKMELRNQAMNQFIAKIVSEMRNAGIYAMLVKGQSVAQHYERPMWRACGDVDFFQSDENYEKAKEFLVPRASIVEQEGVYGKHLGMVIDGWAVELHGRLRCGFSGRTDKVLDEIQNETFYGGSVSSWNNDGVQVFKLSKENEVFYVFAHFLGHFYKGGIGLRQICDWCRLLYTYRESLDYGLLESRIWKAGLLSEWRAFGAMAIEYLGLPIEAMPLINLNDNLNVNEDVTLKSLITQKNNLCSSLSQKAQRAQKNDLDVNLKRKAEWIIKFILEVGNFGHNRDMSFYREGSYLGQKVKSFGRRMGDLWNHLRIFPLDTLRFFPRIMWNGVVSALRGE